MKLSTFSLLGFGASLCSTTPVRNPHKHLFMAKRDNSTDPMYQLSSDSDFHFEILRLLSMAPYEGSDIGEVLTAAANIRPGDYESYYDAFYTLANRVHDRVITIDSKRHPVSARNALFKESSYYRSADFFLHGNWRDPRINTLWPKQLDAFNDAMGLMSIPGRRVNLHSKDGKITIPTIFFASGLPGPRPTIVMGNGYDGAQEEMFHMIGQAVLERGMNVITYEGPGQPSVRRDQDVGFIPDWERIVTPVIDYAQTLSQVDCDAIGLLGYSFGGYLAPRAAAFENRIAAVFAIDGIYDFGKSTTSNFPPEFLNIFHSGNATLFDTIINKMLIDPVTPTAVRWGIQQGLWSFKIKSPFDFFTAAQQYSLTRIADNIEAPMFIAGVSDDMYFPGQAKGLAALMGDRATYHEFSSFDGAEEHCSIGANVLQNQVMLDWFEDLLRDRTRILGQSRVNHTHRP